MLKLFFTFIFIKYKASEEEINLYKNILYPKINFHIKKEYLKANNQESITGSYFSKNSNFFIVNKLKPYYISNKKLINLMKSNHIAINNYLAYFLINDKHKEKISVNNIQINNLNNYWFNKIIKYENIDNSKFIKLELKNKYEYTIKLTKEEINSLKNLNNMNINYYMYLLDNLEYICNNTLCIFDPFTGKKIGFEVLKNMLTKEIILYIYKIIYNSY